MMGNFFVFLFCFNFMISYVENERVSSRVVHNPYHTPNYYAPYNPVSRQDSEISSDAHTDDTRSLTDSSV